MFVKKKYIGLYKKISLPEVDGHKNGRILAIKIGDRTAVIEAYAPCAGSNHNHNSLARFW